MQRYPKPAPLFPQSQHRNNNELSRLFRRSNQSQIANQFSRSTNSSSFLETITNPEKINAFLGQTNKMIQSAQQFKPLVDQYAPLVKNAPSMFKMLQTFNRQTNEENSTQKQEATNHTIQKKKGGDSQPKLYI